MKVSSVNSQIRRKSSFTTIWLFVPFINYIFVLLQMRGAYHALRNHYHIKKIVPNELTAFFIAIKFTVFGVISSSILFMVLLAVGLNPFGEVVSFYINEIGSVIGGFLPIHVLTDLFVTPSNALRFAGFTASTFVSLIVCLACTYFVFGLAGSYLSLFNLRADLKRSQFLT